MPNSVVRVNTPGAGYRVRSANPVLCRKENIVGATDKIKHAMDDVEGKAKEALGRVTGDRGTENEGRTDQAKADLKKAGDKVKDAFDR